MNKTILTIAGILAVILLGWIIFSNDTDATRGQETCPKDSPWTKIDGLSGFTYTFDVPDGYMVTDNCYKASTDVVYGSGDTVTAQDKHELSHASFKLVEIETPEEPEKPEDNCIDAECSNHKPKDVIEEPIEETPVVETPQTFQSLK